MRIDQLKPGDRVAIRCQKAKLGPFIVYAQFERVHDETSLLGELGRPGSLAIPGDYCGAFARGRKLAAFRIGDVVGLFEILEDGTLQDDQNHEVEIVRHLRMGQG